VKSIIIFIVSIFFSLTSTVSVIAMVSGPCSDCHTMHNSQDGSSMNFDDPNTSGVDESLIPNQHLTRRTCVGCHAQGGTLKIIDGIPQVRHIDSSDLAAGNFAYMLGDKGGGASDAKGHNVIDFGNLENILDSPPGMVMESGPHGSQGTENNGVPKVEDFSCAGLYGCHGAGLDLMASVVDGFQYGLHRGDPMAAIAGAHHTVDSTIDGTTVGKSYRFLYGVVGLEVDDWQNTSSSHHNEYHGKTTPRAPLCQDCHDGMGGMGNHLPAGSTITNLCSACHGNMHKVDNGGDGIWIRHPSDIVLPDTGEYADYTTYNIDAPVGRVTVPDIMSNEVTPGTDVVTCLSCHFAHGSNYADLLRWDYSQISAGTGGS